MKQREIKSFGVARKVSFHAGDYAIEIAGKKKKPDITKAYVEFELSHAFPVVTKAGTAIHPTVVANSYASMEDQVFNLGHLMRSYDPENIPRDRILGCIVAVEFPPKPLGGWTVQEEKANAPGIRAVASLFKKAEGVDRILGSHGSGRRRWTVSMENEFYLETSGFLVRATRNLDDSLAEFSKTTPKDLQELGWTYVPCETSPDELLGCINAEGNAIDKKYRGAEVVLLIGGLDGTIHYKGTGLAPFGYGKEAEAEVKTMLASGWAFTEGELEEQALPDFEGIKNSIKSFEGWLRSSK